MKKHNFAFVDIELTGLDFLKHEIIEIGCVELVNRKLSGNTKSAKISLAVYAEERKRLTDAAQQNIERGDDPRGVLGFADGGSGRAG